MTKEKVIRFMERDIFRLEKEVKAIKLKPNRKSRGGNRNEVLSSYLIARKHTLKEILAMLE